MDRRSMGCRRATRGPAVYAMYAGEPPRTWVAYVGMAGDLHNRLFQHFVRRDSSVVAAAAASRSRLHPVRRVVGTRRLRERVDSARSRIVAFDLLEPVLRSRGNPSRAAVELYNDRASRAVLEGIFRGDPAGRFVHARLRDLARNVQSLEARVKVGKPG
jgi:hypothetical protein